MCGGGNCCVVRQLPPCTNLTPMDNHCMPSANLKKLYTEVEKLRERANQGKLKPRTQRSKVVLSKPQLEFFNAKEPLVGFVAGYGCVHPDTRVHTEHGLMRIADITNATRVLSWNESAQRFQLSLSGGSYPKGRANLHRVVTQQGEFVASGHHQTFSSDHTYQQVQTLNPGDQLSVLEVDHDLSETSALVRQLLSDEDAPRYSQTDVDYLESYAAEARQYGQQFLTDQDIAIKPPVMKPLAKTMNSTTVLSRTVMDEEAPYYDMQVANTHNYVTEDGTIHHNSGKSYIGTVRLLTTALKNPDCNFLYIAPTYSLIRDIFYPLAAEFLEEHGVTFTIKKQDAVIELPGGQLIFCRSADDPSKLIGFTVLGCWIDELDTMPAEKAQDIVRKAIGRMRAKPTINPDQIGQLWITTTPEGFKETYRLFVKEASDETRLIQAKTTDNIRHLPENFLDNMRAQYPPNLIEAYMNGQFVNLTEGSVYHVFDRNLHHTPNTLEPPQQPPQPVQQPQPAPQQQQRKVPRHIQEMYETSTPNNTPTMVANNKQTPRGKRELHIGMDFNVLNMSAVIGTFDAGQRRLDVLDEIIGAIDTPTMATLIKERYPLSDYVIIIYPDASGSSRHSSNASESDHQQLRDAGFLVKTRAKNPPVKDRINAVNVGFYRHDLWINTDKAPITTEALEQQTYNQAGDPDKSGGKDHPVDALGYLVYGLIPINRSGITTSTMGGSW